MNNLYIACFFKLPDHFSIHKTRILAPVMIAPKQILKTNSYKHKKEILYLNHVVFTFLDFYT